METLKTRLKQVIAEKGMTINRFEKECGLAVATILNMGESIRTTNLAKIAERYPDLDIRWLLTGQYTKMPEQQVNVYNRNAMGENSSIVNNEGTNLAEMERLRAEVAMLRAKVVDTESQRDRAISVADKYWEMIEKLTNR